jgi:hypothetical protein
VREGKSHQVVVGLILGDLFNTIHPYMAMPHEVERRASADIKIKKGEVTGIIFSKIENFLLAKEVVSKLLLTYEMKEEVETLLIDCRKNVLIPTEKFDQILILNPFADDEWKARLRNIVENNLKLGGNLYIVDTELNQGPRCAEIGVEAIGILLEKNKVNDKEEIGKLEMDNISIDGTKDSVFALRAKNCKVPNPPEIPTAKVN